MSWRVVLSATLGSFELAVDVQSSAPTIALVGPNGSGKSSVVRMISGAMAPDGGELRVAGELLLSTEGGVNVPMERRRLGYMPQGFSLFPHLNVLDNVAYGLREVPGRLSKTEARQAARLVLERIDSAALGPRSPSTLSGGEQQRVALARALAVSPRALLLDEPLSALDVTARHVVRKTLARHLASTGLPTLMVTHDVRDAIALRAECWVLQEGRVVQCGRVSELRSKPANAFVESFLEAGGLDRESLREPTDSGGLG
jgi:ABC-type sulfate/molybdate transport systems ATPase subunit